MCYCFCGGGGGGATPLYGLCRYEQPNIGYGFLAILGINSLSIVAILVLNRV